MTMIGYPSNVGQEKAIRRTKRLNIFEKCDKTGNLAKNKNYAERIMAKDTRLWS